MSHLIEMKMKLTQMGHAQTDKPPVDHPGHTIKTVDNSDVLHPLQFVKKPFLYPQLVPHQEF